MMESGMLVEPLEDKIKKIEGQNICLQWTNHQHVLQSVMSALRNQEYFSDITLAAEGKFFPAHKFVLSTCSSFFEDLLGQTPCTHPVIVLSDTPPHMLSKLLDFMYLGDTEVHKDDFMQLMTIARRLHIKGLLGPEDISLTEEETEELKEDISIKEENSTFEEEFSFASEDFISESKFSEAYQEHIMDDFNGEVYKNNDGRRRMYASPRAKKCPYCSKEFENISHLKEHVSKHQGKRLLDCNSCEYKAFSPSELKRHMLKHASSGCENLEIYKTDLPSNTGLIKCERPFGCYYCPARFIQEVHMTTHVKRMHPTKSIFGPQSKLSTKRTTEASNKKSLSNKKIKMPKTISAVLRKSLKEDKESPKKRGRPKLEDADSPRSKFTPNKNSINSSYNKTRNNSDSTNSLQNGRRQKREK